MYQRLAKDLQINLIYIAVITFFSSYFMDLILIDQLHLSNETTQITKLSLLLFTLLMSFVPRLTSSIIRKYTLVMFSVVFVNFAGSYLHDIAWINQLFDRQTFIGSIGSNVLIKLVLSLLIVTILFLLYKNRHDSYLGIGDLSVYASEIKFLGIKNHEIKWGKLSWISAILIALGTFLLTLMTAIQSLSNVNVGLYLRSLPFIIIFAAINAFAEGVMYRHAVIAPLSQHVPKGAVILSSAILFGSYHYHGVPSGIIGVIMSSILGWFIARSVYETKGFFAGWVIHFLQDVVIFSTIALLG